jgi:fructokinase
MQQDWSLNSVLVASCGEDGLGEYIIRKELQSNNVITSYVKKISDKPSVIFVSKSTGTQILFHIEKPILKLFQVKLDDLLKSAKFSIQLALH